jgi:hypothetical protein
MPALYHITDTPIQQWSDRKIQATGQYRIEQRGKPAGLWYTAHENSWYRFYYANRPCTTAYKYTLQVPARCFTEDIGAKGVDVILVLTPTNINAFVKSIVENVGIDSFYADPYGRLYTLLMEDIQKGAGHFEPLLHDKSYPYRRVLRQMFSYLGWEGDEEEEDEEDEEDEDYESNEENEKGADEEENYEGNENEEEEPIRRILERAGGTPVVLQLLKDVGEEEPPFRWPVFWDAVREQVGGVEFSEAFFEKSVLNALPPELAWIALVELESGVLFRPRTFFKTLSICPTLTHLFCKKDRQRLKTRKGKQRRALLRQLMTRKGGRVKAPLCD